MKNINKEEVTTSDNNESNITEDEFFIEFHNNLSEQLKGELEDSEDIIENIDEKNKIKKVK